MGAPSWLDSSFLTNVLQSLEETKQNIEVAHFECHPAVPPGTNNLSRLYRIIIDYKTDQAGIQSRSLIVKTPLESGMIKDFVEKSGGYKREIQMYSEILPKMYESSKSKLCVTPKSYFCPLYDSLVFEDLKVSGYVMKDRLQQLDFSHSYQFMKCLAGLHALSVAVSHKYPGLIESVGRHFLFDDQVPENDKQTQQLITKGTSQAFVNTLEEVDGCKRYAELVKERADSFWGEMVNLLKPKGGFNVLNHGDLWTANVMFKYNNEGDVTEAKFVDFQLIQFTSFAFDIIYFWWTSANEDVRENYKDELFQVYRKTLNKNLSELDCKERLSKEDFELEMKIAAPYSIFVVSQMLPWVLSDPDDLLKSDTLNAPEETIDFDSPDFKYFKSKYFRNTLPKIMQQIETFGAFRCVK